jgi:hypothetical protein
MRKLTALSVALTLFSAGHAFAGEAHAPAAHAPAAHGPVRGLIKAGAEGRYDANSNARNATGLFVTDGWRLQSVATVAKNNKANIVTEAEKIEATKTEVTDTANTVKTADAPNSGGQSAVGK